MKLRLWLLAVALVTLPAALAGASPSVVSLPAVAQPTPVDWNTLLTPVIVALVPVVVAIAKRWISPERKMAIVSIAIALGPLFDYASTWLSQQPASPAKGFAMGLAAVGLRELVDRARKGVQPPPLVPPRR